MSLDDAKNSNGNELPSQIIEEKINVESIEINCVRVGGRGRDVDNIQNAIILMPGACGSSWTDFRPQIEQLGNLLPGYTIIAWDPPGYGKSIPPVREFPIDFFHKDAKYAHGLITSLGFKRYSVLGWSDGGITAVIMAANYSEHVDKLVIWGVNSYVLPTELELYESLEDVSEWPEEERASAQELYGVDDFQILWSKWIAGFKGLAAANGGNICRDELSQVKAKTLILHGAFDTLIASEHVPYIREHIKDHEYGSLNFWNTINLIILIYYEFPNGHHDVEFNDVVAKFLLQ